MLEGLDLADEFCRITTDFRGQHFHGANHEIRIDDEATADIHAAGLVINAVEFADLATTIGKHGEGDTPVDHFGKFFRLPDFVDKTAVRAHSKHFDAQGLQFIIFGSDRCEFGRSDKGEVAGIEAKDDPLSFVIREFDVLEATGFGDKG